jgi:hypothetical protein
MASQQAIKVNNSHEWINIVTKIKKLQIFLKPHKLIIVDRFSKAITLEHLGAFNLQVMSFSQQVFWYPNGTRTITIWTNHLDNASVILGLHIRYIIDNLINESLSFRVILTEVTFVTAGVASLMLDSTFFVLRLPLDTFILAHVLVKCHFEAFAALSRSSRIFCRNQTIWFIKPDTPVLTDLFWYFFFWTIIYIVAFFFARKAHSLR